MAKSRVSRFDIDKFKSQIRDAIESQLDENLLPDVVLPEVEALVRKLFKETIAHWEGGSGALQIDSTVKPRTEPNPPTLEVETSVNKKNATMHFYVKSYIWNLLDQGRPDRVTKKREKFVGRAKQRTIPGTLDVSNDRSYTKVIYVPEGATIEGFKPRGWTQLIVDDVKAQLADKYPGIEFTFTKR